MRSGGGILMQSAKTAGCRAMGVLHSVGTRQTSPKSVISQRDSKNAQ